MSYLVELGYTVGVAVSAVVMTAVVGYEVDFTEGERNGLSGRERMWLTVLIAVIVSLLWMYTLPLFLILAASHRLFLLGSSARKRSDARARAKEDAEELARERMVELSKQFDDPVVRQSVLDVVDSDFPTAKRYKMKGL